jgi:hypothetical protein
MPGLYANVNVGNTVGLYQQNTGTSQVLTGAQTLLSLLSNAGTVGFSLTSSNTQVQADVDASGVTAGTYGSSTLIPVVTVGNDGRVTTVSTVAVSGGGGSTYSNANVAAYLPVQSGNVNANTYFGRGNQLTGLTGAAAGVYGSDVIIPSINIDANGRIISITTNAVSGGGSYGNANVSLYLSSNLVSTINTTGNITTVANIVSANYLFPNGVNILSTVTGGTTYSNTNVAAYLTTATISTTGNITAANLTTAGNVTASYVKGNGSLLTNLPTQAGTYSNANVASYMPVFGGNILAGNVNIPYTSGSRNRGPLAIGGNVSQYDTGVIASFIGNEATYLYTSLQNSNSGATAYSSYALNDDTHTSYGEMGINSSTYNYATAGYPDNAFSKPYATFIQSTGANLAIGTYDNYGVNFVVNGGTSAVDVMTIANTGNVTVAGNLAVGTLATVGNIKSTNGYFWANGTAYSTGAGGTYGNTQVAAFLPTYSGNIGSGSAQIIGNQAYIPNLYGVNNIRGTATGTAGNLWIDSYGDPGFVIQGSQIVALNVPFKVRGTSLTVGDSSTGGEFWSYGNITANTGAYFIGDGSKLTNISAAQTYGNANVAAYLPTYSGNLGGTLTTATQPYISNIAGAAATTTIGYKASIAAGAGSTVLGSANGIYLNAAIATDGTVGSQAFLNTTNQFVTTAQITGNISSTNGYFWANGTAYSTTGGSSFTGNLAGNTLFDSVNKRIVMQANNLSAVSYPTGTFLTSNFFAPNALSFYGNGVISPATGSGVATYAASANITIGTRNGTNWSPTGQYNLSQIYPDPSAASMANSDRWRGVANTTELYPSGKNWGTFYTPSAANASTAANLSTMVAMNGLLSTVGTGYVSHAIAVAATNQVNPVSGSANIFMQTGTYSSVGWNSGTAVAAGRLASNIGYARLFGGVINGGSQQANLTITNAVGLHITNAWAPGGVSGVDTITNRYAVLNEDASTKIQTNGNLVVTGNTQIQALQETVSATGSTGGAITINAANGTIQTITLTSSISSLSFTNLPPGGTVTLIITQGGSGSYTLTTTGIKYAGGSSTLSTAVGAIDMLNILYDGTNYYGSLVKGYA